MEIHRGLKANLTFENAATVTVTRDSDGEAILTNEPTAVVAEANVAEIKGEDIPEVDLLHVVWVDTEGTHQMEVNVVGNFIVSVEDIKAKLKINSAPDTITSAEIEEQREQAINDIEESCDVAFRHRYGKDILSGRGAADLYLTRRNIQRIISVKVGEEYLTQPELDELIITSIGIERDNRSYPGGWYRGNSNIEVAYVYGHDNFPQAKNPVRDLTAFRLTPQPSNSFERATSMTNQEGNTYALITEGYRNNEFPLPIVNSFVSRYQMVRFA